ncbi:MAG: glycoside hydrolase family 16 protein [Marmoricola sp.]|nr:glycoside hydrolase family 16 protein [Marmoricola sp.]
MSRVPLLAVAGAVVLIAVFGGVDAAKPGIRLVDDSPTGPQVTVFEAPDTLELHQNGLVTLKVSAPAAPGDAVYLDTAGTYGAGYVQVSDSVLDGDGGATLQVPARDYLGTFDYWVTVPATGTHQEVSSAHFPIAIVSPPPQTSPSCGGADPVKADGTPWVCTYDDEFNGPELDRRYWVPQQTESSGFTTGTKTTFACALDSPQTVDVENGHLDLSLVDLGEKRDCGHHLSSQYAYGQVMHYQTYAQTYGKFEVRAKIPDLQVPGSQQSFWLWPQTDSYGPWPASGEIDFAEMYSNTPGIDRPFLHYLPGTTTAGTNQNITHTDCPIKVGEYNTYGLQWEPGRLTTRLNGKVCMIDDYSSLVAGDGSPAPFDKPFYLSLNQAMGALGNVYDPTQVPGTLTTKIDFVRIWS